MDYDFTAAVRKVLAMAREEALRARHGVVGPEHQLLGLLRAPDPQVAGVLGSAGVDAGALREAMVERLPPGDAEVEGSRLPYTSDAKRVLELAMEAARQRRAAGRDDGGGTARAGRRGRSGRRRSREVGVLDLLSGLVGEGRSAASQVLREAGLTVEALGATGSTTGGPGTGELEVVIDDASDRSIYEQIVDQIQEHVAVGAVQPGERLPTVRRLADRLDIAPGTVARAYGELERLGLVVTGGARGTRVAERDRAAVPDPERSETLVGLLRPVAVAAFHLGGTAAELRAALDEAMTGIFRDEDDATS